MISMSGPKMPTKPYLLFHPKFVETFNGESWECQMYQGYFALGWFKEDCFVIDSECRKFPLLDVISHGLACTIWNLLPGKHGYGRLINVEYVFGEPVQMEFGDIRDLYVERIFAMRKSGQNGETPEQFRARNNKYTNIIDFINSVGLMGNLPAVKSIPSKSKSKVVQIRRKPN